MWRTWKGASRAAEIANQQNHQKTNETENQKKFSRSSIQKLNREREKETKKIDSKKLLIEQKKKLKFSFLQVFSWTRRGIKIKNNFTKSRIFFTRFSVSAIKKIGGFWERQFYSNKVSSFQSGFLEIRIKFSS